MKEKKQGQEGLNKCARQLLGGCCHPCSYLLVQNAPRRSMFAVSLTRQYFVVHSFFFFPDDINDAQPCLSFLLAICSTSLQLGCLTHLLIFLPTNRAHWQQQVQTFVDVLGIMGKIWQIVLQR